MTLPLLKPSGFDGSTFDATRDQSRLTAQLDAVRRLMIDGSWRTLAQIEQATGHPQASVSARLRDLRKPQFGRWTVERKYITRGQWAYRLRHDGRLPL